MEDERDEREKVRGAVEKMCAWADATINWKEAMSGLPEEKLKDEQLAMRESLGVELEEMWELYDLLMGAKEDEVALSRREARALGRWLTINIRGRAEIQVRAEMLEKMLAFMQLREELRESGMVGGMVPKKKEEILH